MNNQEVSKTEARPSKKLKDARSSSILVCCLVWVATLCENVCMSKRKEEGELPIESKEQRARQGQEQIEKLTGYHHGDQIEKPTEHHPGGLSNPGSNFCFANALLQCLAVLYELYQRLWEIQNPNRTVEQLRDFLHALRKESDDKEKLYKLKMELFTTITKDNDGIEILKEKGGDSRVLFQTLVKSLCSVNKIENDPVLSLFCAGNLEKEVFCLECKKKGRQASPKKFVESLLMLDVQEELYYSAEKMEMRNFFQGDLELRKCSECDQTTSHQKKVLLTALPEIFALRIAENSTKELDIKKVITRQELSFIDESEGKIKRYEFVSGVYNINRGENGYHSVAYVKRDCGKEGEELWVYNDENVKVAGYKQIHQFPKLLFYRQVKEDAEKRKPLREINLD